MYRKDKKLVESEITILKKSKNVPRGFFSVELNQDLIVHQDLKKEYQTILNEYMAIKEHLVINLPDLDNYSKDIRKKALFIHRLEEYLLAILKREEKDIEKIGKELFLIRNSP
jgi:hypothetical protein